MPKPPSNPSDFGLRLANMRKAADLTQQQLADEIGISRRMLSYYEAQADKPPAHLLTPLADALNVPVAQLLGMEDPEMPHGNSRLLKQFQKLAALPKNEQKMVIQMIEALSASHA